MGHIKKMLNDYDAKGTLRLHMPGHKGVKHPLDATEIPQTGDLNRPSGAYAQALRFLSETHHSHKSFFITNGATLGIQTMVLYAKKTGCKIAAMRNSHMSVINACLAFGAQCTVLDPGYDEGTGTFESPETVFTEFLKNTTEKYAIIVTSPDYYGRSIDLSRIKKEAGKHGVLLFCDEAHGAHFIHSGALPESAGRHSDIWVNGAHKTLGALTQGAFVHCSENIDADMFSVILAALNTSSPSHVIAASLEEAVSESMGGVWDRRAAECGELEAKINSLDNINCVGTAWAKRAGYAGKDVTRVVIDAKDAGGGFYIYNKLYEDSNIQLEAADFRYATAIMTIYDNKDCDVRLFEALSKLDKSMPPPDSPAVPAPGKAAVTMGQAWLSVGEKVKLEQAEGEISAAVLGAYPPGTALVLPGERITALHIDYLKAIMARGGSVHGFENGLAAACRI
jgi:arginine/lysine/ornithine decarboxylase